MDFVQDKTAPTIKSISYDVGHIDLRNGGLEFQVSMEYEEDLSGLDQGEVRFYDYVNNKSLYAYLTDPDGDGIATGTIEISAPSSRANFLTLGLAEPFPI